LILNVLFLKFIITVGAIVSLYCVMPFSIIERIQPYTFDGNEMTIDYHIVVNMSRREQHLVKEIISDTFLEIDQIYNNWNERSEVSKINRLNAYETISLSPQLEHFLQLTEKIVKLSEGRFDPTIAPLQQIWKDHLEKGEIPIQEEINEILPCIGWDHLHFGKGKIFKDNSKTSLDFGGIAKGYCVDLLLERIVAAGFDHVIVEWGGEIRAHGRRSAKHPWNVIVGGFDEMNSQNAIAQIILDNQSIATSGDYIQKWSVQKNGGEIVYFHIINPQTAKPLESTLVSVASATIVAPTCMVADGLTKAVMMHPSLSEAKEWADKMNRLDPTIKFLLFSRERD